MFLLKQGVSVKFLQCKSGKFIEFIPFLKSCDEILATLVFPAEDQTLKLSQSEPNNKCKKCHQQETVSSETKINQEDDYLKEEFENLYSVCKEIACNYPYVQCVNRFFINQLITLFGKSFKIAAIFTLTSSCIYNQCKKVQVDGMLDIQEAQRKIKTNANLRMLLPGAIRENIFHTLKYDTDPMLENLTSSESQTLHFILDFFQLEKRVKESNEKFAQQMWDELSQEEIVGKNDNHKLNSIPNCWLHCLFFFLVNFARETAKLFQEKLEFAATFLRGFFGFFAISSPVLRIYGGAGGTSMTNTFGNVWLKRFRQKEKRRGRFEFKEDFPPLEIEDEEVFLATKIVVDQLCEVAAAEFSRIRSTLTKEFNQLRNKITEKLSNLQSATQNLEDGQILSTV